MAPPRADDLAISPDGHRVYSLHGYGTEGGDSLGAVIDTGTLIHRHQ